MFFVVQVSVYVCVCVYARVWKGRGSAYRAWLEYNSLTAPGKKLSRLPEGRSWKSPCAG